MLPDEDDDHRPDRAHSSKTGTGTAAMRRRAPNFGFHLMDRSPSTRNKKVLLCSVVSLRVGDGTPCRPARWIQPRLAQAIFAPSGA